MWYYLALQTIVLSIAAAFIIAGEYQSNDYLVKRKRDLYCNIGSAIISIFLIGVFAFLVFYLIPKSYFEDGTWIDLDPSMQLKPAFNVKEGEKVKVLVIKED